jgi:predicted transcriptional regulator of viral defense system
MDMNRHRTIGKVSAYLINMLYEENNNVFTIHDAQRILKKDYNSTSDLLSKMTKRGIIGRLKHGKFIIIPLEVGKVENYTGNRFVAAREIINSPRYYIGFYSAMNYWGMVTQPLLKTFIVTPKRQVVPSHLKDLFIFIYMKEKHIWGVSDEWVTRTEKVRISDIEKTILDGLLYPHNCGGITEIAKGIWLVLDKIDYKKLEEYVAVYNKNVIAKRLGYILEILEAPQKSLLSKLRQYIKDKYDIFDPTIPAKRIDRNSWHIIDNIGREQILNIIKY